MKRILSFAFLVVFFAAPPVSAASGASPVPRGSGPVSAASGASPVPRGSGLVSGASGASAREAQLALWSDIVWHHQADDRSSEIGAQGARAVLADWQTSEGIPVTGEFDAATELRFRAMTAAVASVREYSDQVNLGDVGGDDDPVGVLLSVASTAPESARLAVVEILFGMRSSRARAALEEVMKDDDVASVRLAAARSLGRLGDPQSLYAIALAIDVEVDQSIRAPMKEALDTALPIEVAPTVSAELAVSINCDESVTSPFEN